MNKCDVFDSGIAPTVKIYGEKNKQEKSADSISSVCVEYYR